MAPVSITPSDLTVFASIPEDKALAMIEDALAMAAVVAPCILDDTFKYAGAAKAVIRGAILRWHAADSGAITQQQAGPYQVTIDSNTRRNGMYWPSEIQQLQTLCSSGSSSYTLGLAGPDSGVGGRWSAPDTWVS